MVWNKSHDNSLEAFRAEVNTFSRRTRLIYDTYRNSASPMSDRQVLHSIFGPDENDMNKVRPRITKLRDDGWLEEVGSRPEGRRSVRLIRAVTPEARLKKANVQGELAV
jgi:hypothetical protein